GTTFSGGPATTSGRSTRRASTTRRTSPPSIPTAPRPRHRRWRGRWGEPAPLLDPRTVELGARAAECPRPADPYLLPGDRSRGVRAVGSAGDSGDRTSPGLGLPEPR